MSEFSAWIELVIAPDHPAFAGHFPGQPMVPGVVLLDLALWHLGASEAGWRISTAKFLSPALPGEPLRLRYSGSAPGPVRFEIVCGARLIVSGGLLLEPPSAFTP